MNDPAPPERSHLDHQGVWGTRGEHIAIEWYASRQDVAQVVAWYRWTLTGYVETEPGSWIKREGTPTVRAFHQILVGTPESWPATWPTPPDAALRPATLIMDATGMAPAGEPPETGRPPTGRLPTGGTDGVPDVPRPQRRWPTTGILRAIRRRHRSA